MSSGSHSGSIEEVHVEVHDFQGGEEEKSKRRFKLPSFKKKHKEDTDYKNEHDDNNHPATKGNSLKNLFKKRKSKEPNESIETRHTDIDDHHSSDSPTHEGNLPITWKGRADTGESDNPYPEDNASVGTVSTHASGNRQITVTRQEQSLWVRPQIQWQATDETAERAPPKSKSWTRCSVFLVVILIFGFILGVVITAAVKILKVVGACLIVLSIFALIGKIFFTLWSNPDGHPLFKSAAQSLNQLTQKCFPSSKKSPPVEIVSSEEPLKYRTYSNESYGNQIDNGMLTYAGREPQTPAAINV